MFHQNKKIGFEANKRNLNEYGLKMAISVIHLMA
jgi:hypothetical protein